MVTTGGFETASEAILGETDVFFPSAISQEFFRATLAREARNLLIFWLEAAREARRLTPVIS